MEEDSSKKTKTDSSCISAVTIELKDYVSQHAEPEEIKSKKNKENKQKLYAECTIWNELNQNIFFCDIAVLNASPNSKSTSFSAFINKAIDNNFFDFTMGKKFKILDIKHCKQEIKLKVYDMTNQMKLSNFLGCDGFVLLFDLADCNAIEGLKKKMDYLSKHFNKCPVLIVGNLDSEIKNTISDGNFANLFDAYKSNCAGYIQISTKDSMICKAVFESLGGIIYDNKKAEKKKILEVDSSKLTQDS